MNTNLVWLRNDLRITDNPALHFACKNNPLDHVVVIFISIPKYWKKCFMAPRKAFLIYNNIIALQKKIKQLGISFYYYESTGILESVDYIVYFCKKYKINSIFFNYEYGFYEQKRDKIALKKLKKRNIITNCFHDSILIEPGNVLNNQDKMYQKYSHFKKKCIIKLKKNIPLCYLKPKKRIVINKVLIYPIPRFNIPLENFDTNVFPIGEKLVLKKLKFFLKKKIERYNHNRNILMINNTSMLSAHLSIGVISPRQCIQLLLKVIPNKFNILEQCSWINELLWREFYRHLLYFNPLLSTKKSMVNWDDKINWDNNSNYFSLWKQGNTGYPIIDAGMRQLQKTGWLHNRLRMITASFLVKNLLIDWRKGEKYFISKLIDGDIASNIGNWQWISSIGTDSVPYFRIFNPILQSKKFDFNANFIRQYVPELKNIPTNEIHNPYLLNYKKRLHCKYPLPMIDYYSSRKKALLTFRYAKNNCI